MCSQRGEVGGFFRVSELNPRFLVGGAVGEKHGALVEPSVEHEKLSHTAGEIANRESSFVIRFDGLQCPWLAGARPKIGADPRADGRLPAMVDDAAAERHTAIESNRLDDLGLPEGLPPARSSRNGDWMPTYPSFVARSITRNGVPSIARRGISRKR